MCGFLGKVNLSSFDYDEILENNKNLICRGPDEKIHIKGNTSEDFKTKNNIYYSFIFNRLSIIDLSRKASQPMYSEKFNTLIMFNGEIYNHQSLRNELEEKGVTFKSSHSDSEVVLNGFSYFGLEYVKKLIGQFSIIFFDFNIQSVSLIRDRVGQKPLFYNYDSEKLIFSSSLKSISNNENIKEINERGLVDYLDYGVVPSPNTIYRDIYKVKPGEILEFDISNSVHLINKSKYWDISKNSSNNEFSTSKFFDLLDSAVELREIADVPVAVFSSGGIDSTAIIKNMHVRNSKINSYSVGYKENKYDESKWFKEVNRKYNNDSTVEYLETLEAKELINESIYSFDEPYSDPSSVPSYLISKKIAENYKVAISGDGGDELFGSYQRVYESVFKKFKIKNINNLNYFYPKFLGTGNNIIKHDSDLKKSYSSFLSDKNFLNVINLKSNFTLENNFFIEDNDEFKSLMMTDYNFYLSEMMMLKVDSTSMANSLEVRSPFVDHRIIEYILNSDTKHIDSKVPKKVLKNYLKDDFSDDFLFRKKMGFVFDIESWVFKNLNYIFSEIDKLENLFNTERIKKLALFRSRINAHRLWKLYFLARYLNS